MLKIAIHFESFKDYSDISYGINLLKILSSEGLEIEKINHGEPVRYEYSKDAFLKMWDDIRHIVMFKGNKEIKFTGMISWATKIHPCSKIVNGTNFHLTVSNNYEIQRLISLGDKLFQWSQSVYGYISKDIYEPLYGIGNRKELEKCKYPNYITSRYAGSGNVLIGIGDLMWVNYFGLPYIMEDDIHFPDNRVILPRGVRFQITNCPNDERLCEPDFLQKQKEAIGLSWFWHTPKVCEQKIPNFDRSEVIRGT